MAKLRVENYDGVNHPQHYNIPGSMECINEMVVMFGYDAVIDFCRCNAWKYRYRSDSKGSKEEDLKKADWYIRKALELQHERDEKY